MKNISFLLLAVAVLFATSCVTSTYTTNGNRGYANSIYYTSEDGTTQRIISADEDAVDLQTRTLAALGNHTSFAESVDTTTKYVIINNAEKYTPTLVSYEY